MEIVGDYFPERLMQQVAPGRVTFFDTFDVFDRLDYKNSLDPARRVWINKSQAIDNNYVTGHFHPHKVESGGFESVDGMHPSGAGYELIAQKVMTQLGWSKPDSKDLEHAFNGDELLNRFPLKLDILVKVLEFLRGLDRRRSLAAGRLPTLSAQITDLPVLQAIELMKSAVLR